MFNFIKSLFRNSSVTPPQAVIIDVRPQDFIAGGETGVVLRELEISGQYDAYLPDEESQYKEGFDTFGCVSFSAINCIETALNFHISRGTGVIDVANIKWLRDNGYFDRYTGKLNFSDRYIAKLSGTGPQGNSLGNVGDAIRKYGLVPETLWPWVDSNWSSYYAEVPAHVLALGAEFSKRFDISYQWINASGHDRKDLILQYLKYGPMQIAATICSPWNSNESMPPIQGCGCGTQHGTIIYGFNGTISLKDFDHYRSFRKLLAWDYCIPYAVQYYIAEKKAPNPSPKPNAPLANLRYGAPASFSLRQLQLCLQHLGYMKAGVFGPFGPQTRIALAAFQKANNISDIPAGTNYGPKSQVAMQRALS